MNAVEPTYWGLKLYEWLTLVGIFAGPIVAVVITLWVDGRRKDRDQKLTVFRMLMSTRHLPADPAFFTAVNLVVIEFSKNTKVMHAHKEFIQATAARLDGVNDQAILDNSRLKTIRLVYEVARALGFPIRETDLQSEAYTSGGWITRDNLLLDSQKAMRDVATQMMLQTRILAGAKLTDIERKHLGLDEQDA